MIDKCVKSVITDGLSKQMTKEIFADRSKSESDSDIF